MGSPHILVKTGKSSKRYWRREEVEKIVEHGSARDIADNVPHDVQASFLNARGNTELIKRHFVKIETEAIHRAMGRPEPTDKTAEETRHMVEEARRRLRRS